jgi:hypothetical protein
MDLWIAVPPGVIQLRRGSVTPNVKRQFVRKVEAYRPFTRITLEIEQCAGGRDMRDGEGAPIDV